MLPTLLRRAVAALGFVSCVPASQADPVRIQGALADVPVYLMALHRSSEADRFLIIEVDGTPDFIQFTASPEGLELDMPLVTAHQRAMEPRFRRVAFELGLITQETRGSDGSRFLNVDVDLRADTAMGTTVQQFLGKLFGVDEATPLTFVCHGCRPM